MAINDFIEKVCVQPCVHWKYLGTDGMGMSLFSDPVQIKVRWTDNDGLQKDDKGEIFDGKAIVLIPDSAGTISRKDYLFLGEIGDLTDTNPLNITTAYEVQRFTRIPMIFSNTVFVKTVYL